MAALWFKKTVQRITGRYFKYYRLFYSYVFAIGLVLILAYQFKGTSFYLFLPSLTIQAFGMVGVVGGLIVMSICIKKYFANLSGTDVFMKKPRPQVLEVNGLHHYVRHPLYAGTLLFMWGLFLLYPLLHNMIACSIITVYVLIGIRLEENKLKLEFGDAYAEYAHKTPMLIPSLPTKRHA